MVAFNKAVLEDFLTKAPRYSQYLGFLIHPYHLVSLFNWQHLYTQCTTDNPEFKNACGFAGIR